MNSIIPSMYQNQCLVSKLWKEGIREDGRLFDEIRELKIEFPGDWGNCILTLGSTSVNATVQMKLVVPSEHKPKHGFIQVVIRGDVPKFIQEEVTNNLLNLIKKGKVITTESLCIIQGKVVWSLRIDIYVLSHQGNVRDAINWAAITALRHYRRPEITIINNSSVQIHDPVDRNPESLYLHHLPLSFTILLPPDFESCKNIINSVNSYELLVDPTHAESLVSNGIIYISINAEQEVCALRKECGQAISYNKIKLAISIAKRIAPLVIDQINTALDHNNNKRIEENMKKFTWLKKSS